jgi:membrane-bound lytic murein transglycosylase C
MKSVIFFITVLSLSFNLFSQNDIKKIVANKNSEFQQYKHSQNRDKNSYYFEQDNGFIKYKTKIEKLWNEFKESTPTEWVTYNKDFSGRSKVDFKTGMIQISAIVVSNTEEAKQSLTKQLSAILSEKTKDNITILKGQISNPVNPSKELSKKNLSKIKIKLLKKIHKTKLKGKDGKIRIKYTINLKMVKNHLQKRIKMFKLQIEKNCEKFKINPDLALAIIHTESYFNPKAYNRKGNAYGLMQIVPKYAGKIMNKRLNHINSEPLPSYLFNPNNNLKMGIGYLRWLANNKWSDIHNKTNLEYCLIASYNGGPGSIYQAMTGKRRKISQKKWDKMIKNLNQMDSKKLFKHLRRKIPFKETREYLNTVVRRENQIYKK